MADTHRKILNPPIKLDCPLEYCDEFSTPPPPQQPPPPPPSQSSSLSPYLILIFCALAVVFTLICYFFLSTKFRAFRSRFLRRNQGISNETHEDFIDQDHFPVIHHPIWLINTIGLEQSVIDSIEIFKYKKGLTEGTDCSVCLSEFEEEESLRLLPKCSHAFHVPCIDTWLRSHKNCPLCRAPIVKDSTIAQFDPNSSELTTHEEIPVGDLENVNDLGQNQTSEVNFNQEVNANDDVLVKNSLFMNLTTNGVRVQSDLVDRIDRNCEELQPMRRSVSMDTSSPSMVDFVAVNHLDHDQETPLGIKKSSVLQKSTMGDKRRGSSSSISICRVMKSSSFGRSSRKASTSMKRSYSSSDNK